MKLLDNLKEPALVRLVLDNYYTIDHHTKFQKCLEEINEAIYFIKPIKTITKKIYTSTFIINDYERKYLVSNYYYTENKFVELLSVKKYGMINHQTFLTKINNRTFKYGKYGY